jgi:hypothetical protein
MSALATPIHPIQSDPVQREKTTALRVSETIQVDPIRSDVGAF